MPSHVEIDAGVLERLSPHLDALQAIAERRPLPAVEPATSQFDALFPERRAPLPLGGPELDRLVDVMEAVGEAVAFAPLEDRRREAIALLTHLLQLYGMTIGAYLSIAPAQDPRLDKAVARVRLVC